MNAFMITAKSCFHVWTSVYWLGQISIITYQRMDANMIGTYSKQLYQQSKDHHDLMMWLFGLFLCIAKCLLCFCVGVCDACWCEQEAGSPLWRYAVPGATCCQSGER